MAAAIAAVIGGVSVLPHAADAQQRVGSSGQLRDANNMVGSGGFNSANTNSSAMSNVYGNSLVTNDVTGNKEFRGHVGYFDPGQFEGTLPGQSISDFTARSTNVTTSGTLQNFSSQTGIFLGDSRGVNPSSAYISTGIGSSGYIPSPILSGSVADPRLGNVQPAGGLLSGVPQSIFLPAGSTGGSASSSHGAYLTTSPLFGIQRMDAAQAQVGTASIGQTGTINGSAALSDKFDPGAQSRLQALDAPVQTDLTSGAYKQQNTDPYSQSPLSAQQALRTQSLPNQSINQQTPNGAVDSTQSPTDQINSPNQPQDSNNPSSKTDQSIDNTLDSGTRVSSRINGAIPAGKAVNANANAGSINGSPDGASGSQTNVLDPTKITQGQQKAYYRMLTNLQAQGGTGALSPLQQKQLRDYRTSVQDGSTNNAGGNAGSSTGRNADAFSRRNMQGNNDNGGMGAGGIGNGNGSGAGAPGPTAQMGAASSAGGGALIPSQVKAPKPERSDIVVPSFAREETDKPTQDMLFKAEELMKQGKFASALEEYDEVQQNAPSNPYALLGRANAELGATSYGLASEHLRQAFTGDQALLMARYDLNAFLGADRLQLLINDLKGAAQANPSDSRPLFLLSYICYNTNKDRAAAAYLNLAQKRAGKPDPFYKLVQQRWQLPDATSDDADLNK